MWIRLDPGWRGAASNIRLRMVKGSGERRVSVIHQQQRVTAAAASSGYGASKAAKPAGGLAAAASQRRNARALTGEAGRCPQFINTSSHTSSGGYNILVSGKIKTRRPAGVHINVSFNAITHVPGFDHIDFDARLRASRQLSFFVAVPFALRSVKAPACAGR